MILAIDTASKTATVALVERREIIAEFSILSEKTHSKAILPMLESIFEYTGKNLCDIDYIACCAGPGSFTGLRIGASVAKSIAFTAGKKIVPVSSLDALAYNVLVSNCIICPVIDARGGFVYSAFYKFEGERLARISDYVTKPIVSVVDMGTEYDLPLYFIGSGAVSYREDILRCGRSVIGNAIHRAGVLGIYAYDNHESLNAVCGEDFAPIYMSRPAAEAYNG